MAKNYISPNGEIEAVEQGNGEVYIYTVSTPDPHFTSPDGYQFQDALSSWEAFEAWKSQYPGLR